jgi:thiamine pyrophosphate-dependent acetolactate synthase large subunit-like protein
VTGAEAVAKILAFEGTELVSCFPETPLIDACVAEGIRPVVARSERVVVNIADGYSRAGGGRIGVCTVQHDAGAENAFAGIAQAYADSVPVLFLPGFGERRRQVVPPVFDAVSAFRPVTKWAAQINFADRAPELMRRAYMALRTGRSGPVLLELPADVAAEEIDANSFTYRPATRYRTGPDPDDVRKAVDLLLEARRPVLLAGGGVKAAGAEESLRELAEALHLPVATTMNGKGSIPEDHPLALGMGGLSTTAAVSRFLASADTVLAVGSSLTNWWMAPRISSRCTIVQSTVDERDLAKDFDIEHAVLGDAKVVLDCLVREARRRLASDDGPAAVNPVDEIKETKVAWLERWRPLLTSEEVPINPYRVVWELMEVLDRPHSIVTHESGYSRELLAPFFETIGPLGYVGWGHSTQLGYSLGLAIGMKLARPDLTVVNVMGDAAFGMTGMDLETASRNEVGILTIVLNNSMMAGYDAYIPLAVERYGASQLGGAYADLAVALGVDGVRVERPEEIRRVLQRGIEVTRTGRPALIEIITREETRISDW